jgi:hypothetical protein
MHVLPAQQRLLRRRFQLHIMTLKHPRARLHGVTLSLALCRKSHHGDQNPGKPAARFLQRLACFIRLAEYDLTVACVSAFKFHEQTASPDIPRCPRGTQILGCLLSCHCFMLMTVFKLLIDAD